MMLVATCIGQVTGTMNLSDAGSYMYGTSHWDNGLV